jgi:hypothetical protein
VVDYPVLVPPCPLGYRLVLDSDREEFGGAGRIEAGQVFSLIDELRGNELCHVVKVYLPCRSAMVLQRIED